MARNEDGKALAGPCATATGATNPYNDMLDACDQDPRLIQQRYQVHRAARNEQQKAKLLAPGFEGFTIDPVLQKLNDKTNFPAYADPRNCLVFWARPPARVRDLVNHVQQQLCKAAPSLWLMPLDKLHLTTLELAHSRSEAEIVDLVTCMDHQIPSICDLTYTNRCRLVKPAIGYDAAAIALSFLPAAGESSSLKSEPSDSYTYHHLRRDLYDACEATGVGVASRYVLPSAHLTIARFVDQDVYRDGKVEELLKCFEAINEDLQKTTWAGQGRDVEPIEWIVGEERGIVCRKMTVWYGDGESHYDGQGF